jgi:hypothetical protein
MSDESAIDGKLFVSSTGTEVQSKSDIHENTRTFVGSEQVPEFCYNPMATVYVGFLLISLTVYNVCVLLYLKFVDVVCTGLYDPFV